MIAVLDMPLRVWWQFAPMRIASVKVSTDGYDEVPLEGELVASVRAVVTTSKQGDRQDDVVQVAGQGPSAGSRGRDQRHMT